MKGHKIADHPPPPSTKKEKKRKTIKMVKTIFRENGHFLERQIEPNKNEFENKKKIKVR